MASRIAQKKKRMDEEDMGVIQRRKVTASSTSIADIKARAKAEKVSKRQVPVTESQKVSKRQEVVVPVTESNIVETAPVPAPPKIESREDLSSTLKDILQPKQDVKPDTLQPVRETISNSQNIRYEPETNRYKIVDSTPVQNLKTIESVIQSIPESKPALPVISSRSQAEARLPKRSYETPQQYSERISAVVAQEEKLASKGISSGDKASAIVKQAQDISQKRIDDQKAQTQVQEAYANDPWVKERLAMKAERERSDAIFNPIVQGLTDTMDVFVHALPILGGGAGGILAQAYKNFAPPTSQFYQEKSMGDKTVSFLKDNLQDKVKDLGTGVALSQIKNGVNLAKGYRGIALSNKTATKNFGIGKPSVNNPVAPLPTGSQMFVPRTAPSTVTTPITSLPVRSVQAPQRLQAPRTDVLISPRTNVVRR